jgi:hypothetical protein
MKVLNHHESDFLIAHFQGVSIKTYPVLIENYKKAGIKPVPDSVTIVTIWNQQLDSLLTSQLKKNGIGFINEAEIGEEWVNTKKIEYIRKGLDRVKTEYVLILDAGDVLLAKDLTGIIDRFKDYDRKLLFGATKSNYPKLLIDKIHDRDFRGDFCYLNAGTAFGYTEYAKDFYSRAAKILDTYYKVPYNSEQFIIRHTFKDCTDEVDFDYNSSIFQTFGQTEIKYIGDERYVIV